MKLWFTLFAAIVLSSCAGYSKPICNDENRVDVPNLEGRFSISAAIVQEKESIFIRQPFTISRLSRGTYFTEDQNGYEFSTCEIENQLYLESVSPVVNQGKTYFHAFRLQRNGDGSVDLIVLGTGTDILNTKGISYKIVENQKPDRPNDGCVKDSDTINCTVNRMLLIDNSGISSEAFTQLLDPLSFQLKWTPEISLGAANKPLEKPRKQFKVHLKGAFAG